TARPAPVLNAETLFGPTEGWSLTPVGIWLLCEGRRIRDAAALLTELMARLDAAGARIDRLRITSRTLHPQLVALGGTWRRGVGVEIWNGQHGVQESEAYVGSPLQFVMQREEVFRKRLGSLDAKDHPVLHELHAEGLTDYVAVPMVFSSGTSNAMMLATKAPQGFDEGDVERFVALANLLAPVIEILNLRRTTLGLLNTFVGHRISERILQGQVRRGDGDRIEAAFWYSDLRGFTALSETLPTDELLRLLNEYFEFCAAAAAARGGEILQFIGDAILIVFEIHHPEDEDKVCAAALDAAVDAFASIAVVNHRRRRAEQPLIEFGLGLHLGVVTHANVGAPDRLSFNVVGPAVNMTARIQDLTKKTGVPLLLSADFARHIRRKMRSVGRFDLRGIGKSQELFTPVDE
ncbi:MAG: adenylate/guanylate cyclase domain-containing protein, partial [Burkholderiaceae bacterium]